MRWVWPRWMIGSFLPTHSSSARVRSSPSNAWRPERNRFSAVSNDTLPLNNGLQRSVQSFGALSFGTRLVLKDMPYSFQNQEIHLFSRSMKAQNCDSSACTDGEEYRHK